MSANLANLNHCAVHFLSRAGANLCWYYYTEFNLLARAVHDSYYVIYARAVHDSYYVIYARAVHDSYYVIYARAVYDSYYVIYARVCQLRNVLELHTFV